MPAKHPTCASCPAFAKSAFHTLSPAGLEKLAAHKKSRQCARGTHFNIQDEPVDAVYCLAEGNAKVTRTGAQNKQSIVRIASPGELLGYRCVFSEKTFRATGTALEATTACTIDKDFLLALMEKEPALNREILERMGRDVAVVENHHHSFVQKDARERIAEALETLRRKCGVDTEQGWRLNIQLSRVDLANWVGVAKGTCIRCLSDLREEGVLEIVDRYIYLRDLPKLHRIAGLTEAAAKSARTRPESRAHT